MPEVSKNKITKNHDVSIAKASHADVRNICMLAHKITDVGGAAEKKNNGFIIPYTENEYHEFAEHADYFFTLYSGDILTGFVLAHSSQKTNEFGGEVYKFINESIDDEYIIVRQICVDPEYSRKGYGKMLYEHIFRLARKSSNKYAGAICFIWKKPLNMESEKFHNKTGWKEINTYSLKNGKGRVGIWKLPFN